MRVKAGKKEILILGYWGNESLCIVLLDVYYYLLFNIVWKESAKHSSDLRYILCSPGALFFCHHWAEPSCWPVAEAGTGAAAAGHGCWERSQSWWCERRDGFWGAAGQIKPSVLYFQIFTLSPVWSNSYYFKWLINYLTLNRYPRATCELVKARK